MMMIPNAISEIVRDRIPEGMLGEISKGIPGEVSV